MRLLARPALSESDEDLRFLRLALQKSRRKWDPTASLGAHVIRAQRDNIAHSDLRLWTPRSAEYPSKWPGERIDWLEMVGSCFHMTSRGFP